MLEVQTDPDRVPRFTAEELENSFPLDLGRRFRHPSSHSLLRLVLDVMEADTHRQRKRGTKADDRYTGTVEAMLANLVASHLNAVDSERFIGVSFDRNSYVGMGACRDTMARCRDLLLERGLIEHQPGFQRWDGDLIGKFGRRTRIRPSDDLRTLIDALQPQDRVLSIPDAQLVRMKKPASGVGPPPEDVEASRELIKAVNARLAKSEIELDDRLLTSLRPSAVEDEGEDQDDRDRKRSYAGDFSATALYRSFKGDWNSGGRLYGGWWMSLPRRLRPWLRLNGSEVVELDYKSLHPLLLYMRAGVSLDFDPYVVGESASNLRDLGKRTFNRLLNRAVEDPAKRLRLRAGSGDPALLPKGASFGSYLASFIRRLDAIQHWFGTGEGVRLQREDSDLAIAVITEMERTGVAVLPIHDSFIVASEHEEALHAAMVGTFYDRHGVVPPIKAKRLSRGYSGHTPGP